MTIDRTGCPAPRHGTYAAYQHAGCRCPDARNDHRLYGKRRREGRAPARRIPAIGTQRRIQALWAIGHSSATIAAATGELSLHFVQQISLNRRWVSPHTAELIDAAYRRLSVRAGVSPVTRGRAVRDGYPPPAAWDDDAIDDPAAGPHLGDTATEDVVDDVLVQRAVAGDPDAVAALNKAERVEATRRLLRRVTAGAIARRLNVSGATAVRLVAQAREEVAA